MKNLFWIVLILASVAIWQSAEASIKKSSETIIVGITAPLDSAGLPGAPDSIQVVAWPDNAATATYTASITAIDGDQFDTITVGGVKTYVFRDAIADIDGAGGNFELAVFITAFYKKLPTQSPPYYVQVLSDSLENLLTSAKDSSASAAVAGDSAMAALRDGNVYKNKDTLNSITVAQMASLNACSTMQSSSLRGAAINTNVLKAIDTAHAGNIYSRMIFDSLMAGVWNSDSALIEFIVAKVSQDSSFAMTGVNRVWNLAGFHVRATGTHDTAIIGIGGTASSGYGAYFSGYETGAKFFANSIAGVGINAMCTTYAGIGLMAGGSIYDISNHNLLGNLRFSSLTGNIVGRVDSVGDGGVNAIVNNAKITAIIDTVNGIIDTLQLYDGRTIASVDSVRHVAEVDTLLSGVAATATTVGQIANIIAETLMVGRDVATGAEVTAIDPPSVAEISTQLLGVGMVTYNQPDSQLRLANLIIIDKTDDDTGGVYIHSPLDDGVDISSVCDSAVMIAGDLVFAPGHGIIGHLNKVDSIPAVMATLTGTGIHSYMLLCLDTTASPDAPVNGVQVEMWNLAQTVHAGINRTNINGYAGFNLDTGMYVIVAQRPGYYFPTPDTVHVTGAMYDTTKAYQSNVGLVSVGGYIYGLNYQPVKDAKLVFSLPKQKVWLDEDSTIVWSKEITCYTDSLGHYSTSLLASSRMFTTSPATDTLKYGLSITYGAGRQYDYSGIIIPDSVSVTFSPKLR